MDGDQDQASSSSEEESRQLRRRVLVKTEDAHSDSSQSGSSSPTQENLTQGKKGKNTTLNKENLAQRDPSGSDSEDYEESCNDEQESDDNGCQDYSARLIYKPSPEEKTKLANLTVHLNHEVPPQHEIERTAGTRYLKTVEKEKFEQFAELKTGKFSKEEHKIIRRNWKEFCELHDWDDKNLKPFLQMRYKNKVYFIERLNRMRFVQFLAKDLPNRSLYSVYHTFRVIFDPHKKSRYSQSEDNTIIEYLSEHRDENNDRSFADLALILRRTRASVWRRYRLLKNKEEKEEGQEISSFTSKTKRKRVSL